jgi:hypothetical protein
VTDLDLSIEQAMQPPNGSGVEALRAQLVDAGQRISALTADSDRLRGALTEVIGTFVHRGHRGRECRQSGWIPVETVDRWHAALAGTES